MPIMDDAHRALLFTEARTHRAFCGEPVADETLRELYELLRLAPTAMNAQPARFVFVKSPAAKERLVPALAPGNVEKVMAAAATAIVAYDTEFHEKMAVLAPHSAGLGAELARLPDEARQRMGYLSAALQGAYCILAARGLGLDCGPMSGFDNAAVDGAFFPDGKWRSILLVNLGHGEPSALKPRQPRLPFDEACRIE
ncbi:MAG: malonic semialdehyde reductase [Proteobacteria bacterium]|jgi:3-hydroxypropanoate dehydrogenase|nr:malonic semialdehyde reductase [Pseudomonadota bacterium]